ncbi:DNA adenine methylase [Emticicia soli]|uniref:site-specific DNA-methyltransferase (adenine-specific) n=1 Tax=Emticicia soli TaxID=2027878 RepID=A0ABW5JAJ1_9BACT
MNHPNQEVVIKKKNLKDKINTPFGYFGSKNKIALQLCKNLPPHNCWVEAFCGSAALTLAKQPAQIEVINDIDNEIINFFAQLRQNSSALIRQIELTPYAEQELYASRIKEEGLTDLERARRFLIQSMMAINGVFGEERGGFSYSDSYTRNGHEARVNRWNNLPNRLSEVVKRLKNVRIENKDARRIINRYLNRPATLIYLDPPYLGDRSRGYNKDANDTNFHIALLELVNKAKCMIFISGYENELYNQLLRASEGWEKKVIPTSTSDVKGNMLERLEVVWMNKYYVTAYKNKEMPIVLTTKEQKEKKVNPIRQEG